MQRITLGALLRERGLVEPGSRAIRNTLHAADRSSDIRDLDQLRRLNLVPVYERMQNGRRLGHGTLLLSFVAEPGHMARLIGYRRVFARRKGIVPGEIVYDYDAAPLLHAFIARARCPVFYDTQDEEGLGDLFGRLVLRWPLPLFRNVRSIADPSLTIDRIDVRAVEMPKVEGGSVSRTEPGSAPGLPEPRRTRAR